VLGFFCLAFYLGRLGNEHWKVKPKITAAGKKD
jgi:hypothetical protein